MIAPLAISLALSFWAPYSHGQPVCPDGVQITYEAAQLGVNSAWVDQLGGNCSMHIRADIADQQIPYQCMIVAHELGHAAFGLPDDPLGPPGIMNGPMAIPGACYPPKAKRVRRLAKRLPAGRGTRR